MAALALVGSCLLVGLSANLALGGLDGNAQVARRFALLASTRAWLVVRSLGRSRVVEVLLGSTELTRLCNDLALHLRARGASVIREDVCAALLIALGWAMLLGSLVLRTALAAPLIAVGSAVALRLWRSSRERAEARELAESMPEVFRTLAMAMGSGETLAQAISYVGSHDRGAAGRAFHRASLRLSCGESSERTLALLVNELDAPGVGLLATALLISQRTGSPLVALFQRSASLVERQGEFERMLSVKTAQVRLSVRIVSLLPPAMVCALSLLSPDFRAGLMTVVGLSCVVVAALMDAAALAIIRHLMKGVL